MGATGWARPAAHPPSGEAGPEELAIFVCGAHMSGMALNGELVPLGARLLRSCLTAPSHKLCALGGRPAATARAQPSGAGWPGDRGRALGAAAACGGPLPCRDPAPLGLGSVALQDGSEEVGFICEPIGVESATDVSQHGGWRGYLEQLAAPRRMTVSAASK